MKRGAHYHCPVNGWSCPYYKNNEIIDAVRCILSGKKSADIDELVCFLAQM